MTSSGHDEPDVPPLSGPADQVNELADPASEPRGRLDVPPGLASEPSDPAIGPVNSAGGPVSPADEPSGSASEPAKPAEPQPGPASQSAIPVAGFVRPDGEVAALSDGHDGRDGQAPPTAQFSTAAPWLEPGRGPAGQPGQDSHYPGDNGAAGGRLPQLGPLVDLEARDLAAWFGDHKVLEGVSLKMEAGKVTALIGPSGCGKSTFLRTLNRMHELVRTAALAGEVLLGGENIYSPRQRPADVRRRIGMVFQKPNPFPAMSVYDNVTSGLKLAGVKVRSRDEIVELSLRRAGLWNEMRRRLRTPGGALSGGQQQRLCIARSLAVSPDVLLMDEPCSALDPTSTRRIEETIRELADQVTIVIVTHNMQQAQRVSANCAFFLASEGSPGYIVESGPTEQLFSDPVDPRTAAYIHGQFG